jgi:hypothetical protein
MKFISELQKCVLLVCANIQAALIKTQLIWSRVMTNLSISYLLPSQQELDAHEVVSDCLEKLKALTLAVTGTDFFEQYADQLCFHHYLTLVSDLVEIAAHQANRKEEKIN